MQRLHHRGAMYFNFCTPWLSNLKFTRDLNVNGKGQDLFDWTHRLKKFIRSWMLVLLHQPSPPTHRTWASWESRNSHFLGQCSRDSVEHAGTWSGGILHHPTASASTQLLHRSSVAHDRGWWACRRWICCDVEPIATVETAKYQIRQDAKTKLLKFQPLPHPPSDCEWGRSQTLATTPPCTKERWKCWCECRRLWWTLWKKYWASLPASPPRHHDAHGVDSALAWICWKYLWQSPLSLDAQPMFRHGQPSPLEPCHFWPNWMVVWDDWWRGQVMARMLINSTEVD